MISFQIVLVKILTVSGVVYGVSANLRLTGQYLESIAVIDQLLTTAEISYS